jgi:uncharacterized protein YicC (UPF0701 family)
MTPDELAKLDDKIRDRIRTHFSRGEPTKRSAENIALDVKATLMGVVRDLTSEIERLKAVVGAAKRLLDEHPDERSTLTAAKLVLMQTLDALGTEMVPVKAWHSLTAGKEPSE